VVEEVILQGEINREGTREDKVQDPDMSVTKEEETIAQEEEGEEIHKREIVIAEKEKKEGVKQRIGKRVIVLHLLLPLCLPVHPEVALWQAAPKV
jgi:hypothetical protein